MVKAMFFNKLPSGNTWIMEGIITDNMIPKIKSGEIMVDTIAIVFYDIKLILIRGNELKLILENMLRDYRFVSF